MVRAFNAYKKTHKWYTAISIHFVKSKHKTKRQKSKVIWDFFLNKFIKKLATPYRYSEDLWWRAIWMKEILGYQVDEVAAVLRMSSRTIEQFASKVSNFWEVKTNTIGRPISSVAMHPHLEFLIMEAVLEHPEDTVRNCAWYVYWNGIRFFIS